VCSSDLDNTGVLILSEMAGASKELIDALIVNPTNIHKVKDTLIEALNMPSDEMKERMIAMRQMVFRYNINHWVKIYMQRLKDVKVSQSSMKAGKVNDAIKDLIKRKFNTSEKRLILLDYDGTLVGFQNRIELASPDQELYNLLDQFASDKRNHTVIISGRKHQTLE